MLYQGIDVDTVFFFLFFRFVVDNDIGRLIITLSITSVTAFISCVLGR